jgi:hypothetical protein
MSSDLFRTLWDWWNTLEPEFKFLMCLPFVVPGIAALGDACRRALARLRGNARDDATGRRATAAPASRAR